MWWRGARTQWIVNHFRSRSKSHDTTEYIISICTRQYNTEETYKVCVVLCAHNPVIVHVGTRKIKWTSKKLLVILNVIPLLLRFFYPCTSVTVTKSMLSLRDVLKDDVEKSIHQDEELQCTLPMARQDEECNILWCIPYYYYLYYVLKYTSNAVLLGHRYIP